MAKCGRKINVCFQEKGVNLIGNIVSLYDIQKKAKLHIVNDYLPPVRRKEKMNKWSIKEFSGQ